MSTAKVIEIIAEGKSIENAIENAVSQAAETLHSIRSVWVENINAIVEKGKITRYRINAKITFVLD
ncbi:MAG: dodecin domain-containing protein [Verrucomicrobiales bacterium]|jgi:flavin-binding protein dodecin|nr:dodecin domain-containing protein [Verrucomicrobiales bacterium]HQW28879.1 dodecin family protein [Verrucomicrobiales bacterium]